MDSSIFQNPTVWIWPCLWLRSVYCRLRLVYIAVGTWGRPRKPGQTGGARTAGCWDGAIETRSFDLIVLLSVLVL